MRGLRARGAQLLIGTIVLYWRHEPSGEKQPLYAKDGVKPEHGRRCETNQQGEENVFSSWPLSRFGEVSVTAAESTKSVQN
jgi:hypothetical protein